MMATITDIITPIIGDWRQHIRARIGQTFIAFDHGDHLHIVYSSLSGGENPSRTRHRIGTYLHTTDAGSAEAFITNIKIANIRRFLYYCLRNGITTGHFIGNHTRRDLTAIHELFRHLYATRDPDDVIENANCRQYHEEGKQINKRMGSVKSRHLAHLITQKVEQHDIQSSQQRENRIAPSIKLQLIKEFGLSVDSYIQTIIRIVKADQILKIKKQSLTDLYIDMLQKDTPNITPEFTDIVTWIKYLFHANNINIGTFMAWNEIIRTKRYMKINGLVLQGMTNSGKSLIVENMIGVCRPEEIPRGRDNSAFHLDQLPASSAALFEEPLITPVNVGTWKLLLEGRTVKTDIKHRDKEGIPRLPIWITTATPITTQVDHNEALQIQQRIKIFIFKRCIAHRRDGETLTTELTSRLIRKAPGYVTPLHFAYLWIQEIDNIKRTIEDLRQRPHKEHRQH